MTNVANHRLVLHQAEVALSHDVLVSGCRAYDVGAGNGAVHSLDLVAVHGSLKRTNWVNLGDDYACTSASERSSRALAHVAVACNHHNLTGHHEVGSAAYRVYCRLLAAVFVVELRLGHRIVHVDGRQGKGTSNHALVEAVHPGSGFFRNSANAGNQLWVAIKNHVGQVAAVVKNHVEGMLALAKKQGLLDAPIKFFFGHALPGIHADSGRGNSCSCMVLRRENIARRPGHLSAQLHERFNQNSRLNGHVQAACNPSTTKGLTDAVLLAKGHQSGHFCLGEGNFFASPFGKGHILYFVGHVVGRSSGRHNEVYLERQR